MKYSYVACKPPFCKCPEIIIDTKSDKIIIKDDFNGQVEMTQEQFDLIVNYYKENRS